MFDGQVNAPANEIAGATGSGRTIAAWRAPEDAARTDTGERDRRRYRQRPDDCGVALA
jgi:hypothetical protein